MEITFETLPQAVNQLSNEISEIKKLLLERTNNPAPETDQWFDLNQLCNYLPDKPAKPTVYGWVHASTIPCHKGGKKLRFLKTEIDQWLKTGRKKTIAEIANETDTYLSKKKRS
jgi:excisionase family DNA binding protein